MGALFLVPLSPALFCDMVDLPLRFGTRTSVIVECKSQITRKAYKACMWKRRERPPKRSCEIGFYAAVKCEMMCEALKAFCTKHVSTNELPYIHRKYIESGSSPRT